MATDCYWFRLSSRWHESEWLADLDWPVRAVWPLILGFVGKNGKEGICKAPSLRRFASAHDVPLEYVNAFFDAVTRDKCDRALLVHEGDWIVTKWDEYQKVDRTANERQQRRRAKIKQELIYGIEPDVTRDNRDVTQNTDDVTRDVTPSCRATTTTTTTTTNTEIDISSQDSQAAPVPVADIDIDIDKRPKAKAAKPDASWFGPWFEEFKTAYPKRQGNNWKQAATKLKRLFEGSNPPNPNEVLNGAKSYANTNPEPQFTAHVTTWVNQARWAADYSQVAHTPSKPTGNAPVWTAEDIARMMGEE
jgi:hypothetical protein